MTSTDKPATPPAPPVKYLVRVPATGGQDVVEGYAAAIASAKLVRKRYPNYEVLVEPLDA